MKNYTLKELKGICKKCKIKGYSNKNKKALIKHIRKYKKGGTNDKKTLNELEKYFPTEISKIIVDKKKELEYRKSIDKIINHIIPIDNDSEDIEEFIGAYTEPKDKYWTEEGDENMFVLKFNEKMKKDIILDYKSLKKHLVNNFLKKLELFKDYDFEVYNIKEDYISYDEKILKKKKIKNIKSFDIVFYLEDLRITIIWKI